MRYVVNAFSLNMFALPSDEGQVLRVLLEVEKLSVQELCNEVAVAVNAIGHQGTADLINLLCNTSFRAERREIKVKKGEELLLVQVLARLPEGKVLSKEEIEQLLKDGKVAFYKVRIL